MTAAAPARSACALSSTVSRVDSAPVPATTGTRSAVASTVASTSWRRSGWLSVVNSPVLPPGTSPATPASIRRSTIAASAPVSIALPSSVNGVMSAGSTPWKGSDMGHLSDSGIDAFGGRAPGAGGGLDVSQLGEVVARQVQVLVRAERALQRRLKATAAGARIDVAKFPAVHGGAGDHAARLRVELVQLGEETLDDPLVGLAHQCRGAVRAREQHQAPAGQARVPAAQR